MQVIRTLIAVAITLTGISAQANPDFWRNEWPDTNFDKTNVPSWAEILSGGPPKEGIPALNDPGFTAAAAVAVKRL